jgi:hypothetical protein
LNQLRGAWKQLKYDSTISLIITKYIKGNSSKYKIIKEF